MIIKRTLILFILSFTVLSCPTGAQAKLDLSLSFGPWTASPFAGLVENQFRSIIDQEIQSLTSWVSPFLDLGSISEEASFSSNGIALTLSIRNRFPLSPWSLGIEISWMKLNLPYTIDDLQTINIAAMPPISILSHAYGTARIRSVDTAVILQFRFLKKTHISADLAAGIHILPLWGNIDLNGRSTLTVSDTPINLNLSSEATLSELRQQGFDIPRTLVYPSLSLHVSHHLTGILKLVARLTLSQGLFAGMGLSISL